jgi:hypothetical protein
MFERLFFIRTGLKVKFEVTPIALSHFNLKEGIGERNCLNDLWIKTEYFS